MNSITMNQGSVSSWVPAISEVVNVITQEVKYITRHSLEELSDSELEDLQFESSLEAGQVAGEITELMEQQRSIGSTIRTFLAKEYVKASIHRMATQTRRKFYPGAAAEESRGSLHILVDEVCEVLLKEDVEKFKDTVPVRIPKITQTLVDLLFEFVTSSCSWHQFVNAPLMSLEGVRPKMYSDETIIEYQNGIKQDIRSVLESFLKVMSCWMNHQLQVHSEKVQLAIIEASAAPPRQSNPIPIPTQVPDQMDQQESIGKTTRTCLSKEFVKASSHCMVKQPLVAACEDTPAETTPKRRGAIGRFFSSVGTAITNVCRCRGPRPM